MQERHLIVSKALAAAQDKLYAMIYVLLAGSFDTMDVLQETNAAILKNAGKYDESRPALPWFKAFAMNQVLYYRRVRRDEKLLFDTEMISDLAEILDEFESSEGGDEPDYVELLERCLEKLPPWQRELLKERYQDGEKVNQMAARRLMTRVSLSVLMFRIRKVLQVCIEKAVKKGGSFVPDKSVHTMFISKLEAVLDGSAALSEQSELLDELSEDPELRRVYVAHARMHAILQCRNRRLFSATPTPAEIAAAEPLRAFHWKFGYPAAAAVCVVIALGALWLRHSGVRSVLQRGDVIHVMVREISEDEWLHQITPLDLQAYEENLGFHKFQQPDPEMLKYEPGVIENPGAAIEVLAMEGDDVQGRHLVRGDKVWREQLNLPAAVSMKFQLEGGARITLIGPATLEIEDAARVFLRRGAILVECDDQMLALKLPGGEVHNCNATFCADNSAGNWSDVMALSGVIKVTGAVDGAAHYLPANEGLRLAGGDEPVRFRLMAPEQVARAKFLSGKSRIVMNRGRL